MPLAVRYDVSEDAVVVGMDGAVDLADVDEFSSHLKMGLAAASRESGRVLIVDLQGVDFFGSRGLRALLECHNEGVSDGIAVRLVATNRTVVRVIEVTELDKVFALYPTVDEALRVAG